MEDYKELIQSLIDEERDDPIDYIDIKYALRDTKIDYQSYNVLYNSLIKCLYDLIQTDKIDREFIIKNNKFLMDYANKELNRLLSTFKRTIERYHCGEIFKENKNLFNEEINANVCCLFWMNELNEFIFQNKWIISNELIQSMLILDELKDVVFLQLL